MKAGVIKIPADWHKAVLSLKAQFPAAAIAEVVSTIDDKQEEWMEKVLDDSALDMLNNQFDHLTAEKPEA
jgi:hypothetical protein